MADNRHAPHGASGCGIECLAPRHGASLTHFEGDLATNSPAEPEEAAAVDVSIVIVASDVRDELLRCLQSIEQHAAPLRVETILVDNGSTDGTHTAVANRFPDVTVLRRPSNEGVAARNHGLGVAAGRVRMFLDSDARLTPGALLALVRFIDQNPHVGLVGPKLVYPDGRNQFSARRFPPLFLPFLRRPPLSRYFENSWPVRHHLMADETPDQTREVEYVLGACQVFSARAQQVGGAIDSGIFFGPDDADWCFRIRSGGLAIAYHPAATVVHDYRRTTAQRLLSRTTAKHFLSFYRFQWIWRLRRKQLIREGRAMDERAARRNTIFSVAGAGNATEARVR